MKSGKIHLKTIVNNLYAIELLSKFLAPCETAGLNERCLA